MDDTHHTAPVGSPEAADAKRQVAAEPLAETGVEDEPVQPMPGNAQELAYEAHT